MELITALLDAVILIGLCVLLAWGGCYLRDEWTSPVGVQRKGKFVLVAVAMVAVVISLYYVVTVYGINLGMTIVTWAKKPL